MTTRKKLNESLEANAKSLNLKEDSQADELSEEKSADFQPTKVSHYLHVLRIVH